MRMGGEDAGEHCFIKGIDNQKGKNFAKIFTQFGV